MVMPLLSLVNSFLIFSHIIIVNSVFNWWRLHYIKVMNDEAVNAVIYSLEDTRTVKIYPLIIY